MRQSSPGRGKLLVGAALVVLLFYFFAPFSSPSSSSPSIYDPDTKKYKPTNNEVEESAFIVQVDSTESKGAKVSTKPKSAGDATKFTGTNFYGKDISDATDSQCPKSMEGIISGTEGAMVPITKDDVLYNPVEAGISPSLPSSSSPLCCFHFDIYL